MALNSALELLKPRISALSGILAASAYALGSPENYGSAIISVFAGMALTVGAASGFNMLLEADTDAKMERTRHRPFPSGRVTLGPALLLSGSCALTGLVLLFFINPLASLMALLALVLYAFVYTPLKRRTPWAFLAGVLPGAAPPWIGWIAATSSFGGIGLWLFVFIVLWQIPHIMAIYTYLRRDYARAGIPLPNDRLGDSLVNWLALPFGALALLLCPLLGRTEFGMIPASGLAVATLWLLLREIRGLTHGCGVDWAKSFKRDTLIHMGITMALLIGASIYR